jgi:hypothetical protein
MEVADAMNGFQRSSINRLDREVSNIENKFWEVWGQGVGTEVTKNGLSLNQLKENRNREFHKMLLGFGIAQEEMYKQRVFGPNSRMESLTWGLDIGEQYQVGIKTEQQLKQKIIESLTDYDDQWTDIAGIQAYQLKKEISNESVEPLDGTFDPQQLKAAQDYTEMILNPIPEIQISEDQKKTLPGKKYEIVRQFKKANLILPQLAYSENTSFHSPSLPMGNTAATIDRAMGGAGNPASVKNGYISPSAMLELMSDSRFANPNWYAALGEKNKHAMLRDLLMSKALELEEQKRQWKTTQLSALLLAQKYAGTTNKYYKLLLDEMYKQTITADVVN